MITAIAIDDEKNALGIILEYSKKVDGLTIAETFSDPEKGLEFTKQHPAIDTVFMDIQMGSVNGMTLAPKFPKHTSVVLTTAHPEYAINGYELDVMDYLMKPFSFERFEHTINKIRKHNRQFPNEMISEPLNYSRRPTGDDSIFIKTEHKVVKIRLNELKIIEGAGNYVALITEKFKILTLQNMKSFEEYLYSFQFIRVHKSFIISIKYIDEIENNTITVGDRIIPIGESYKENLQRFIDHFAKQF